MDLRDVLSKELIYTNQSIAVRIITIFPPSVMYCYPKSDPMDRESRWVRYPKLLTSSDEALGLAKELPEGSKINIGGFIFIKVYHNLWKYLGEGDKYVREVGFNSSRYNNQQEQ